MRNFVGDTMMVFGLLGLMDAHGWWRGLCVGLVLVGLEFSYERRA